jgi:hypothetical protein
MKGAAAIFGNSRAKALDNLKKCPLKPKLAQGLQLSRESFASTNTAVIFKRDCVFSAYAGPG